MEKILFNITDSSEFESMKLVCKRWYTILHQSSFWQDLYTSRYGLLTENTRNWKLLYTMKLRYPKLTNRTLFNQLIDATLSLRKATANDVVRLWEDLSHQNQLVHADQLADIDYILSHS